MRTPGRPNTLKTVVTPGENPGGRSRVETAATIMPEYKLFRLKRGGPPSNKGVPSVRNSEEYREGNDEKYLEQ